MPLRVEEFRRNAFEITQIIATADTGATTISADLTAKYYQGQPVAAGKVKHFSRVTAQNPLSRAFPRFPLRQPPHRGLDLLVSLLRLPLGR